MEPSNNKENIPPVTPACPWPPLRPRKLLQPTLHQEHVLHAETSRNLNLNIPNTPLPTLHTRVNPRKRVTATPKTLHLAVPPRHSSQKSVTTYRNGYAASARTPSFSPYKSPARQSSRRRRGLLRPPAISAATLDICPLAKLAEDVWNKIAHEALLIQPTDRLREFQCTASDYVRAKKDLFVIAPTGSGKSLLFSLPLLSRGEGVVLVTVPFTNLGRESALRNHGANVQAVFLSSTSRDMTVVATAKMVVVYMCPEFVEGPTFAHLLHSTAWRTRVTAIFHDEGHTFEEARSWRSSYSRLHKLRQFFPQVPLVVMSATLPQRHRETAILHAGISKDASIINLGNHRPELTTAVIHMKYDVNSFQDIAFLIPLGAKRQDLVKTIIYCDDRELLRKMLFWAQQRLAAEGLSPSLVEHLHAGLTEHHETSTMSDFRVAEVSFLLTTRKLGPGLNVFGVQQVITYTCKGLTMVEWDQRRGRMLRGPGDLLKFGTGRGVLVVESRMAPEDGNIEDLVSAGEDRAILELLQRQEACLVPIYGRHLEFPANLYPKGPCIKFCSSCDHSLLPIAQLIWTMVEPGAAIEAAAQRIPVDDRKVLVDYLTLWRQTEWLAVWQHRWPTHGPKDLVSDDDIKTLSTHGRVITDIETLSKRTRIVFPHQIGPALLPILHEWIAALPSSLAEDIIEDKMDDIQPASPTPLPASSTVHTTAEIQGKGERATVKQLKDFLRSKRQPLGGNKAELVERVRVWRDNNVV
ncbi:P-loop containing nucleoside triphosphate hydrolase protein [Cylindrobasidium torrendii FP15055 ss-10]|uniref:DNA 3'-5' helicase n=1 Tax=Cylindrobasidium torrendii FP15055 ss-10 TaxID=1314674 RepID=A0A0D7BNI2_9AGAR|nr:P-loop containing nucleoside triphosphate hydrolase protein [Cylindrobasidium torrendii FP15055 ss-10]